ncbi:MAG: magnesium/cobalt transporter CorA [Longimicrobiales bacterium]
MSTRYEIDPLSDERRRLRSCWCGGDGTLRTRMSAAEIEDAFRSAAGTLWVDIDSRSDDCWRLLESAFHFHPLAIEDTRVPDGRVKIEEYPDYLFIVARGVRIAEETPEPYDIETSNRYFFLGQHYLVSVHEGASTSARAVADRIVAHPELIRKGADNVLYMFLDQIVDRYFPVLDALEEFIDEIEDTLMNRLDREPLQRIIALKRTLIALRRHLAPQRELLLSLSTRPFRLLSAERQIYLRDVHDHAVRQVESIEVYRDLLSGIMETHLTLASNRINEVMKALSVVATIVLPPTLVASIYGMNFDWLPLAGSPAGFWLALGMMAAISGAFLLYLKRREWL